MMKKNKGNILISDILQDEDIKLFLEVHEKVHDSDHAKKLLPNEIKREYRTPQVGSRK